MSEETGGNLPAQSDPDGQLELWGEMLAVERERIASRNRAVEAMREGFAKLESMLFWGGEEQRTTAILLMTHALSAGGFLAVGFFVGRRSRA